MSFDFSHLPEREYLVRFAVGTGTTLLLFISSWVSGFAVAILIAVIRLSTNRAATFVGAAFVEYHRNVPTIVQLFVWYFGIPQLLPLSAQSWINARNSEFIFACIGLSLLVSAYISQDLRSGFRSIPKEQGEAARALGLSYIQTMRDVLLPQAIKAATPQLVNQALFLFKSTSLAMAIGVAELSYVTRDIENETYRVFESFAAASAIYFGISLAIMTLGPRWTARSAKPGR